MSLSSLFQQIETVLPTLDGWCTVERAQDLAAQVIALRPMQTVVLGVWGGRDTFALALAHKYVGMGTVLAIDPWSAPASAQGQVGEDEKWWSDQSKHELVYGRFIENLGKLGLPLQVRVIRQRSDDVTPPEKIGILIVDGNHGPQAVKDVERFAPNVVPGGIVYMDDIQWSGGHVVEALGALIKLGFREIFLRDNGAFFQRVA